MIRLYNKKDIPSIVALEKDTLGTTLGSEMLEDNLSNSMSHFYVYEDKNEIIGYISISFDQEQGEILNFCVNKRYQHKGIGTKILAYAMNILHSKGAKSFILEVRESNRGAISLYEKFGFKRISLRKNYYSNNENALVYLKEMISYKEVEEAYILAFCKKEVHDDYIYYHDDELKTKYFHNYYVCKNDDHIMENLYHRESFVQFDLEHPYTGKLKFSDYEYEIDLFKNKYIEAYVWGVQDGTVKRIDNVELFYYSTTHALLNLCKTLSYSGVLVSQDEKTSKEDEIKALIDIILYRLSNK